MRAARIQWMLVACALAGCTPLSARQTQRRESGAPLARGPDATPTVRVEDLVTDAHTLPDSQRVIVETALAALHASSRFVDCSGFVQQVFQAAGVPMPRTVHQQWRRGLPVDAPGLRPGDLVFFAFGRRTADHVGIYAGRGHVVHVSSSSAGVQLAPLEAAVFAGAWVGARRVLVRSGTPRT